MKLKQISIFIENQPGRLFEVARALGEAGINIRATALVDTGDYGVLRLLVSDVAAALRIMMKKHMPARVDEVVAAEIVDEPGSLANLLKPLLDAQINIVYTYSYIEHDAGKAVMIFRFSDNDKATEILKANGFKLLDESSL
ncbi:MAG: ACT domain-containing protein [Pseudomonadota bacterium]